MSFPQVFHKSTTIHAGVAAVWDILTSHTEQWVSDEPIEVTMGYIAGSEIRFEGLHKNEPYLAKGIILAFEEEKKFSYTFWNTITGTPDSPEYYATIEFSLSPIENGTQLEFTQRNFSSEVEFRHYAHYWNITLDYIGKMANVLETGKLP
jgi:hypothetical protein